MLVLSAGSVDLVDREPLLLCWERFSQTTSPTHRGPPAHGGPPRCRRRLFMPRTWSRRGTGDRFWGQVGSDGRTMPGQEKGPFAGPLLSPLTDSNRRSPPYHALRNRCRGLPSAANRLASAVLGVIRFATGCHWLRPAGSINAQSRSPPRGQAAARTETSSASVTFSQA